MMEGLASEEVDLLLSSMTERSIWEVDTPVEKEGELDGSMYMISSGEARIVWSGPQVDGKSQPKGGVKGGATGAVKGFVKGEEGSLGLFSLGRGACFGEQCLVPKHRMRRLRRKTTVLVSHPPPLVLLVLSPATVERLSPHEWFVKWLTRQADHVAETAIPGVDAVTVTKLKDATGGGQSNQGGGVGRRYEDLSAEAAAAAAVALLSQPKVTIPQDTSKVDSTSDGKGSSASTLSPQGKSSSPSKQQPSQRSARRPSKERLAAVHQKPQASSRSKASNRHKVTKKKHE